MKYIDADGKEKSCAGDYSLVAEVSGHKVIKYHEFGSYQGEWLLLSKDDANYYVWKGDFGSCSGCDHLQSALDTWDSEANSWEKMSKFMKGYKPSLTIPKEQFEDLYKSRQLLGVFPCNFRQEYSNMNLEEFVKMIEI